MGQKDHRYLSGRSTDLFQAAEEQRGCGPNPGIDETNLFAEKDVGIDESVDVAPLLYHHPERVFNGMDGLCDFHQRFPLETVSKID